MEHGQEGGLTAYGIVLVRKDCHTGLYQGNKEGGCKDILPDALELADALRNKANGGCR
jgi:hypothetical protein